MIRWLIVSLLVLGGLSALARPGSDSNYNQSVSSGGATCVPATTFYNSANTGNTVNLPAGCTAARFQIVSAGGKGGNAASATNGAGGGSGGFCDITVGGLSSSDTLTLTIGAGSAGTGNTSVTDASSVLTSTNAVAVSNAGNASTTTGGTAGNAASNCGSNADARTVGLAGRNASSGAGIGGSAAATANFAGQQGGTSGTAGFGASGGAGSGAHAGGNGAAAGAAGVGGNGVPGTGAGTAGTVGVAGGAGTAASGAGGGGGFSNSGGNGTNGGNGGTSYTELMDGAHGAGGGGGGGGASTSSGVAGNGGTGADCGGAGGGGGLSAGTAGTGSNGGSGCIIITSMATAPVGKYVATANHGCLADAATTAVSCTASAGITSGNALIVCAFAQYATTNPTALVITDTKGGHTYTPIGSMLSGGVYSAQMFYAGPITDSAGGTISFTNTPTGGTGSAITGIIVSEYSGLTPTLDSTGTTYAYGTTANFASGAYTPGAIGDLMAACSFSATSVAAGYGSWISRGSQVSNEYKVREDTVAASTSSQTAPFINTAGNAITMGAAFK